MRTIGRLLVVMSLLLGAVAVVAKPALGEEASTELTTYRLTGELTVLPENEDLAARFSIRDPWSVTYAVDPSIAPSGTDTFVRYLSAVKSLTVTVGDYQAQLSSSANGDIRVVNDGFSNVDDVYGVDARGLVGPSVNNLTLRSSVSIANFIDPRATTLNSLDIDVNPSTLLEFPSRRFALAFQTTSGEIEILMGAITDAIVGLGPDSDGDRYSDEADNCPTLANPTQSDADMDGLGDVCDESPAPDTDGDGIYDNVDNCVDVVNPNQSDVDADGLGDVCDLDDDSDGMTDAFEIACGSDPLDPESTAPDHDDDGLPDCLDPDDDNDGVLDGDDVCTGTSLYDFPSTSDVGINRYALIGDAVFHSNTAQNNGIVYTTVDTGGCSATQIADALGLGKSHYEKGITRSVLESWIEGLNG